MRYSIISGLILVAIASVAGATESRMASATDSAKPVLIELVLTKYLDNVSAAGGYMQVKFANTGGRVLSAIAFDVVPYANGAPVLEAVKHPVILGFKGDFKPGETYTVTGDKPVWQRPRLRVNCVHIVGVTLEYADGQIAKISRNQVKSYMRAQIAEQNCSNPSAPGPHN